MPVVRPIAVPSRTDAIIAALADYVRDAGLVPGDRLPSERDLASGMGVSRPMLREAFRHLETLGVIQRLTGNGTYLKKTFTSSDVHIVVSLETERESLVQVLQLRRALESEVAALVAARATDDDIEELANLVEELEVEFASKGNNPVTDRAFHQALYDLCGNPLFHQLLQPLAHTFEQFWQNPLGKRDFARRTLPLHRRLYERIRDHDPEGAREVVWDMLTIVEEDLRDRSEP